MDDFQTSKRSFREVVPKVQDLSWQRLDRKLDRGIPFMWHHHPEIELTLTLNCRGQRFIGDNVSGFGDGDLAMVGSNLPHSWVSGQRLDESKPFAAKVIWFDEAWAQSLSASAPELNPIATLVAKSKRGLGFSGSVRDACKPIIQDLFDQPQEQGFLKLVELLLILASDEDAQPLATQAVLEGITESYARIDRVLHHMHANYDQPLRLETLADIAALSPSGLHRMFKKHMQTTVSEYLINLRIGEASARLASTQTPIGVIASDVGYTSQANFNRQFQRMRGMSPRAYRLENRADDGL